LQQLVPTQHQHYQYHILLANLGGFYQ